jgi:Zn-dependent peptidase ImmA (M78 family)
MSISASAFASALLDRLGIADVPDVRDVASRLGISIVERNITSFDGALVRIKGAASGIIALRESIRESGRKNFTIAHELGHLILPGHDESTVCAPDQVESWARRLPPMELAANEFAGSLLMPVNAVLRAIENPEPSLAPCEAIAARFETSLTAAAYRFTELTSYPCAVVWSSSGEVKWFKPSPEFSQRVRVRERLDERTFAFDAFRASQLPRWPERVPVDAWLEGTFDEGATILEESRAMPYYDAVLTLLWLKEPPRNDSEDALEPLDPREFGVERRRWPGRAPRR